MSANPLLPLIPQEQEHGSVPQFRPGQQNSAKTIDPPPESMQQETASDSVATPPSTAGEQELATGNGNGDASIAETSATENTNTETLVQPPDASNGKTLMADGGINPIYFLLLLPLLIPVIFLFWRRLKKRPFPVKYKAVNARFETTPEQGYREKVTPQVLRDNENSSATPAADPETDSCGPASSIDVILMGYREDESSSNLSADSSGDSDEFADFDFLDAPAGPAGAVNDEPGNELDLSDESFDDLVFEDGDPADLAILSTVPFTAVRARQVSHAVDSGISGTMEPPTHVLEAELTALRDHGSKLLQEATELRQQLADKERRIMELTNEDKLPEMEKELESITVQLKEARSKHSDLRDKLVSAEAGKQQLLSQINELNRQLDEARQEDTGDQVAELEQQLAALRDQLNDSETQKLHAERRLHAVSAEKVELKSQLVAAGQELEQLRGELEQAADQHSAEEIDGLQNKIAQLQDDLKQKQQEHAIVMEELDDARDQLAQRTSPSALSASVTEEKLKEKTRKLATIRQKFREKLDIITELHKRLRAAKKEAVNLNLNVTELHNLVESQREELARQTVLLERNNLDPDE